MVGELAARHALPKEVVEGVTERTGGVPLFVEEVTRLLLERGEQGGSETIPASLQLSLTARLDRLGSAREVAQIGSVIGRDLSYALIRAVAEIEDASLQAALDRLAEADILLVTRLRPASDQRLPWLRRLALLDVDQGRIGSDDKVAVGELRGPQTLGLKPGLRGIHRTLSGKGVGGEGHACVEFVLL
jgi:hypothetical protein